MADHPILTNRTSGHEFQLALLITPVRTDVGVAVLMADIFRLLLSLTIICFAAVSCFWAMYAGVTLMPDSLPNYAVFILFFTCLFLLAITEGLHVSAVQVAYQDHRKYLDPYPRAAAIMKYQNEGRNLQHFLIGRQIIVLFSVFVLGRCTTFDSFFDHSLPSWIVNYIMFSGFFGVILVVQVGQLVPQIISSNFPIAYMNIRVVSWIYYLCLALEKTGVCYTVWLICWCIHKCMGTEARRSIGDLADKFTYTKITDSDAEVRIQNVRSTVESAKEKDWQALQGYVAD